MADLMVDCPLGPCPVCGGSGEVKASNMERAREHQPSGPAWQPSLFQPALCGGCEGAAYAVRSCPCGCGAGVCEDCAEGLAVIDGTLTALWEEMSRDWKDAGHG